MGNRMFVIPPGLEKGVFVGNASASDADAERISLRVVNEFLEFELYRKPANLKNKFIENLSIEPIVLQELYITLVDMEDGHSFTKDWETEDGIPYKYIVRLLSQDGIHHFAHHISIVLFA